MSGRYTICSICGRVFIGPSENVEICDNCGNKTQFEDMRIRTEKREELGVNHE